MNKPIEKANFFEPDVATLLASDMLLRGIAKRPIRFERAA
jgi:hypothetical protein